MNQPAKYLNADARRAATVQTVVQLAANGNPSDISTTAIARAMGVTQGALFKHFPSKDAIFAAVMGWVAQQLWARIEQATAPTNAPLEALEALFDAHIGFVSDHPGVPRMLFGQLQCPEATAAKQLAQGLVQRYKAYVQELLTQGQAQKVVAAHIDTSAAAVMLLGAVQGLIMQAMLAGDHALMQQQAPKVFALYRQAITAQEPPCAA